jgi:hypothetical protein
MEVMTGIARSSEQVREEGQAAPDWRWATWSGLFLTAVGGAALTWAGALAGIWFGPLLVGVLAGACFPWTRAGVTAPLGAACAAAIGGWSVPLVVRAGQGQPVAATAREVAALAGLPAYAALVISLSLVVAVLQASAGFWVGRATTDLFRSSSR